jgi:hypothetical protein
MTTREELRTWLAAQRQEQAANDRRLAELGIRTPTRPLKRRTRTTTARRPEAADEQPVAVRRVVSSSGEVLVGSVARSGVGRILAVR